MLPFIFSLLISCSETVLLPISSIDFKSNYERSDLFEKIDKRFADKRAISWKSYDLYEIIDENCLAIVNQKPDGIFNVSTYNLDKPRICDPKKSKQIVSIILATARD